MYLNSHLIHFTSYAFLFALHSVTSFKHVSANSIVLMRNGLFLSVFNHHKCLIAKASSTILLKIFQMYLMLFKELRISFISGVTFELSIAPNS